MGHALGQYEYHEDKGYYVQTSTDQNSTLNEYFEAAYLYRDFDERDKSHNWWVSGVPGQNAGWLGNPSPSQTLPTSGWKYADGQSWQDDLTLTVTPGPLTLPRQFTVAATGAVAEKWPESLGVFTKTQRWWRGRPVYVNTAGVVLFHGANGEGWTIGDELGCYHLRGSRARHSPVSENRWRYFTGSEDKPASVTVTGSD